ncbi:MAG: thiamine pyrophosphate-binding protein [Chloroflexi bacterium]|nr:thiamine pyrophosphate-binding protein [Chloroflexota bacterium]
MIVGTKALEMIAEHRTDEVMVTTMSSARVWPTMSSRPDLDLPIKGCMGKASSVALGLALARPDKRIVVLDGDGSLLMNFGSLVTITSLAPKNLVHVVLEGTTYDTSGGQPTPGRGVMDWATVAKGAGYKHVVRIDTEDELADQWPKLLKAEGPVFAVVSVNSMWAFGPMPGLTGGKWQDVAATLATI